VAPKDLNRIEESMTEGLKGGHVFVFHGDLLKLACDSVLISTDASFSVREKWGRWQLSEADRSDMRWEGRVSTLRPDVEQSVRYVDIGATPATADIDWLRNGVREGLIAAVRDARTSDHPLHDRERRLIGMPLFGVEGGGFDHIRGQVLDLVLEEAQLAANQGPDVAIVCFKRSDYSALQSRRDPTVIVADLKVELVADADEIGRRVRQRDVALFLGAGVSVAAGVPDWKGLLRRLASNNGVSDVDLQERMKDGLPAASSFLKECLQDKFEDQVKKELTSSRHTVSHGLLASLMVDEVITTNFDVLFEDACEVPWEGALTILPRGRKEGRPPWLLKLHGDLSEGRLVMAVEEFENHSIDGSVLMAMLEALLVTRHLVFVGYSMQDADFVQSMAKVARLLHSQAAGPTEMGSVLSVEPVDEPEVDWEEDLRKIEVGDKEPGVSAQDARALEIFLDRVAWRASRDESSWILDKRYEYLLDDNIKKTVEELRNVAIPDGPGWQSLRQAFKNYGRQE
jgi:NAD-dependent SIR2 family protein deacetylase